MIYLKYSVFNTFLRNKDYQKNIPYQLRLVLYQIKLKINTCWVSHNIVCRLLVESWHKKDQIRVSVYFREIHWFCLNSNNFSALQVIHYLVRSGTGWLIDSASASHLILVMSRYMLTKWNERHWHYLCIYSCSLFSMIKPWLNFIPNVHKMWICQQRVN